MCHSCVRQLTAAYDFIQKCLHCEEKIRNAIRGHKQKVHLDDLPDLVESTKDDDDKSSKTDDSSEEGRIIYEDDIEDDDMHEEPFHDIEEMEDPDMEEYMEDDEQMGQV